MIKTILVIDDSASIRQTVAEALEQGTTSAAVNTSYVGRYHGTQRHFNASLVDHLNRNIAVGVEAHHASLRTIDWIGGAVDRCEGAKDEIQRHLEALLARERRNENAITALAAQHEEIRAAVAVMQQSAQTLKRELAQLGSTTNYQLSTGQNISGSHSCWPCHC